MGNTESKRKVETNQIDKFKNIKSKYILKKIIKQLEKKKLIK